MLFHENRNYKSAFPLDVTTFTNYSFNAHWHTEIELVLVCEGSIAMGINTESQVLEKGDIAICACGDIHYYKCVENSTILILVFRPELMEDLLILPKNVRFMYPFLNSTSLKKFNLDGSVLNEIRTCMDKIYREYTNQDIYYKVFLKTYVAQLVSLFLRHVPKYPAKSEYIESENRSRELIYKAIQYIEYNYYKDITLDNISDYLGISPTYFSRLFSKITGQSFKLYLNSIRIQKVENQLISTTDPIINIAYECGFNSIRTFNRVYKAIKGVPPSFGR